MLSVPARRRCFCARSCVRVESFGRKGVSRRSASSTLAAAASFECRPPELVRERPLPPGEPVPDTAGRADCGRPRGAWAGVRRPPVRGGDADRTTAAAAAAAAAGAAATDGAAGAGPAPGAGGPPPAPSGDSSSPPPLLASSSCATRSRRSWAVSGRRRALPERARARRASTRASCDLS